MIDAPPFRSATKRIAGEPGRASARAKARKSSRGRSVSTPKSLSAGLNTAASKGMPSKYLPGKWQTAILEAEQNRPKSRVVTSD